jgi:hypothetical protein
MKVNEIMDRENLEAVVGVFETSDDASRVAASLRGPDVELQRVSRVDPTTASEMPQLIYDNVDRVDNADVNSGIFKGGAIGAGSGLLFFAVPGLNIAAPIAGALAGAFIGGVAGIDETNRAIGLPDKGDYQQKLRDGKSFVVLGGDERTRIDYANKMKELGAIEVHQHPPVLHAIRKSKS